MFGQVWFIGRSFETALTYLFILKMLQMQDLVGLATECGASLHQLTVEAQNTVGHADKQELHAT